MKSLFSIILVVTLAHYLYGQTYYSKSYDPLDHGLDHIRNIIIEDSTIYASSWGTCEANTVKCFKFAKFDLKGNYLEGYEDTRFETGYGMEHDGEYLFVDNGNEPYNTKLIANRIHKESGESDILEFTQDSSEFLINISCTSNNNHFITYGTFDDLTTYYEHEPFNRVITRWINKNPLSLDTTIIIPVRKRFTNVSDAASDEDGNVYFICIEKELSQNGFEHNFVRIVKYSPNAELIWDYLYPNFLKSSAYPSNIVVIDDKIIFQTINDEDDETIVCIDESGAIHWKYTIDNERTIKVISVTRMKKGVDGNLLLCGWQRSPYHKWVDAGFIMKINIETGKLMWERIFEIDLGNDPVWGSGYAKSSSLWDVEQLTNGDIIAGGWIGGNIYDDPNFGLRYDQDLWLIRVDSNGCLEPGCGLVQSIRDGVIQKDSCKWLEDGAVWHYTPWREGSSEFLHKIEVVRDTTLGNRVCSVLGVTENGQYIPESELIVFYEWQREEVYFYEDEQWKKLFDFSWSVGPGDTVEFYLPQNF